MKTAHGLIIGKFYPPHAGHHLVIRTAAACCDRVSVIVMASTIESIPLADRVAWLKAVHAGEPNVQVAGVMDDLPIDLEDDGVWSGHVVLMRDGLARLQAPRVTAVFTSEAYGEELARRFDAIHVAVDPQRRLLPISGKKLRADMVGGWEQLEKPVRGALAFRAVVLGAASTGTTTLVQDLAAYWRMVGGAHRLTRCVPEFGRSYSVDKYAQALAAAQLAGRSLPAAGDLIWDTAEFEHVARTQLAQEDAAAADGGPVLICDTDAFATTIWHERYVGGENPVVGRIADRRFHPLYLVTHHDGVAYQQDGLRHGTHLRHRMTERFIERLGDTGRRFVILRGSRQERLEEAVSAIRTGMAAAFTFAPPRGPRRRPSIG